MNSGYRVERLLRAVLFFVVPIGAPAFAETPGEIPKPWTYEGSKKLQEQQQQPSQPQPCSPAPSQGGARGGPTGGAPGAAAADAARRQWQSRPALAPENNPLLGKWTRPASTGAKSNDPFSQLQALAKGGLCEALFGGGVFEFRTDRLMGMDQRTPPQELDRVEYRGDSKHVVVLPKATVKLMEWDFEGPNRINWASQNCVLVRVGNEPQKIANAGATTASTAQSGTGGVLLVSVGALSPTDHIAGRKLWILKADPQFVLIKAGVTQTPYGTVLQNWMRSCEKREQLCATGMQALQPVSVGFATADAGGQAKTPPLAAGRYWVLSDARIDNRHVMWHQPVDVKGSEASLTLDQRNAISVN